MKERGAREKQALASLRAARGAGLQHWLGSSCLLWGFPECEECLGHLGLLWGAHWWLISPLVTAVPPVPGCFCAWCCASGGDNAVARGCAQSSHPLLFLPKCLQTFPVYNVILWQSINFSFCTQVILHVTPTGKSSLCIVPDGFEKQSSQHLRAEFAASASLGYITKEPFYRITQGSSSFPSSSVFRVAFLLLHGPVLLPVYFWIDFAPFNVQTFVWSAGGDLWAHRFTNHELDELESHFSYCRIFKILVEHFKARPNTIFHQLKAGHLPNVADTMPFWLKKAVCNPKQSLVSLEGSCGPCY